MVHTDEGYVGVQPPGYSMEEFAKQDGYEKAEAKLDGGGETIAFSPMMV